MVMSGVGGALHPQHLGLGPYGRHDGIRVTKVHKGKLDAKLALHHTTKHTLRPTVNIVNTYYMISRAQGHHNRSGGT